MSAKELPAMKSLASLCACCTMVHSAAQSVLSYCFLKPSKELGQLSWCCKMACTSKRLLCLPLFWDASSPHNASHPCQRAWLRLRFPSLKVCMSHCQIFCLPWVFSLPYCNIEDPAVAKFLLYNYIAQGYTATCKSWNFSHTYSGDQSWGLLLFGM